MLFRRLTDLSYQRTITWAIVFYVVYFLLFLFIGIIVWAIAELSSNTEAEALQMASRLGITTVTIASAVLAFLVARKKNLLRQPIASVVIILAGICAMFGGALLGLLPIAYLTMKEPMPKFAESTHRPL